VNRKFSALEREFFGTQPILPAVKDRAVWMISKSCSGEPFSVHGSRFD
jgi:hypothetical protein